jgi:hypothetical protein
MAANGLPRFRVLLDCVVLLKLMCRRPKSALITTRQNFAREPEFAAAAH